MPSRARFFELSTGGVPLTLKSSSTRSLSKNTPRTPCRSTRSTSPR